MFPLGTVLFPHQPIPLHVFEPRYRQMTAECLEGDREFGVVLIERGSDVGGGESRFDVGTVARISEAVRLEDGRFALLAVGGRRFGVSSWLEDDPYPKAVVDELSEERLPGTGSEDLAEGERLVRRSLAMAAELGEAVPPATFTLDPDRDSALWQLCAVCPLSPLDKQCLLEQEDPDERLRTLERLVAAAGDLFAYRLSSR